jgi:hypothetical protein
MIQQRVPMKKQTPFKISLTPKHYLRIGLVIIFSAFITSCDLGFPKPPDVKHFYMIDLSDDGSFFLCQQYEVISYRPFKIKRIGVVPTRTCDNMSGYRPDDQKKVLNWIEDIAIWAESQCR